MDLKGSFFQCMMIFSPENPQLEFSDLQTVKFKQGALRAKKQDD